ncbi:(R)-mandelonitrile lyase [Mucilaginibacter phyllosphaerae]|uniref:Quercetin dioxygenase-like cupin family protein n=2 Tax=Mucilaginibacter phyllosphaerae TaxID=1812349 RepID=A0ABR6I7A8_9SPHI|nr:cupin domain-containing protein [Mucilaginibacter phyllosphaerae]MBB3968922.1 quercetin dioxygenase-like cupin family protein [Mucilaginibacter phyllosphaerae]
MKVRSAINLFALTGLLLTAACTSGKNQENMTTLNDSSLFPKGDKLPDNYFTGNAFLKPLLPRDANNDFLMGSVTFEAGARTVWHTHPKGQVLIVTEGKGWYQQKGKAAQAIQKGDVINIPENTEHWHGASADTGMVHIAITNYKDDVNVFWLKPVTEEEYAAVNKK